MQRLVGVWIGRSEKRVPPVLPSNCNQDPFETRVANQSRQGCQVRYVDPKGVNLDRDFMRGMTMSFSFQHKTTKMNIRNMYVRGGIMYIDRIELLSQ